METAPWLFASSTPKMPTGAIGAMKSMPKTTSSRKPRERRSEDAAVSVDGDAGGPAGSMVR
ncbi:hypothetical protein [Streptacidiphilus pinicola]|uniref:hypothetical protein n=1 Tax=Streptacidiphilus pinicola TaxID=2219663 RepID=UPI001FB23B58|nr:hypothetical protein [Streptacidiphilus pinicola]